MILARNVNVECTNKLSLSTLGYFDGIVPTVN